jgi:hypothetical protein
MINKNSQIKNHKSQILCFHLCYLLHLLFLVYNGFTFIESAYRAGSVRKFGFFAFWALAYISQITQALSGFALKGFITAMGHRPRLTLLGGRFLHMIY